MMKRLTEKEQDYYRLKDYQDPCKAIDQLGRYEDIGFSPEELRQLIDKQKWHVVADGDLPPKRPRRGFLHLYIVTYNYEDDPMINPRTGLAWYDCKGEWIGYNEEIDDFESGDVLAWRELPEPWEGEK